MVRYIPRRISPRMAIRMSTIILATTMLCGGLFGLSGTADAGDAATARKQVSGIDVSRWQGNVDWNRWWADGKRFAYIKATEGTSYRNPYFAQQYNGSYGVGMIRGAYHFALPAKSSGTSQADYFVAHGGGWSPEGQTLPGALDIEHNPSGATCYGLSPARMVRWIKDFTRRYRALTGRDPVIYTSTNWWAQCTGNSSAFGATSPLWLPRYAANPGAPPAGWWTYSFWQHTNSPIDQDTFNGSVKQLRKLATG